MMDERDYDSRVLRERRRERKRPTKERAERKAINHSITLDLGLDAHKAPRGKREREREREELEDANLLRVSRGDHAIAAQSGARSL